MHFGADDMDGTVVTEEIFHQAGASSPQVVNRDRLVALIEEAGRIPVERDTLYNPIGPQTSPAREPFIRARGEERPADAVGIDGIAH